MNEADNIFSGIKELSEKQGRSGEPYAIPEAYFSDFTKRMTDKIADEEALSVVLKKVPKEMPYAVPTNYFNEFFVKTAVPKASGQNRVRNLKYTWKHLLAAAVTIGIILLSSILFYPRYAIKKKAENAVNFAQQKIETMPTEQLTNFLYSTDNNFSQHLALSHTKSEKKSVDFNQIFEKISDKDLKKFLEETGTGDDDFLLN